MLHDPETYPDPFAFKPERFLGTNGKFIDDPLLTSAFGFGRRLCPARHFVDTSLYISFSCILSVFHVGPPKDELGNEIPITIEDSGANSRYVKKRSATLLPHIVGRGKQNKKLTDVRTLSFLPVAHWAFGAPSFPGTTTRRSSLLRPTWPGDDDSYDRPSQSPALIGFEEHDFLGLVLELIDLMYRICCNGLE